MGTLLPWVPDNSVLEVIPDDVEAGLAVHDNGGRILLDILVNAVDWAFDAEIVGGRLVFGSVEDLVNVCYSASETGDLDLRDVLKGNDQLGSR